MIKSRRMRWGGHIACMNDKKSKYSVLAEKPEDWKIIFK
jgi:hypothetical protein